MSQLEHYRELYNHEKNSNQKMLAMIASVPKDNQSDARFQQAVFIAGHLAACREFWLTHMAGKDVRPADKDDGKYTLAMLSSRFAAIDSLWTDYLAFLDEGRLAREFEFAEGEERFSLPTEVQIVQLFGHASYHRGQIALLVDQLGGEVPDTDYVDWWWATYKETEEKEMQ